MIEYFTYLIAYGLAPALIVYLGFEMKRKNKEIKQLRRLINQERTSCKKTIEGMTDNYKKLIEELKKEIPEQK